MAIDYGLNFECTTLTPDGLLTYLRAVGGEDAAQFEPDRGEKELFWMYGAPAGVDLRDINAEAGTGDWLANRVYQEGYGFVPSIHLGVRPDKFEPEFSDDDLTRLALRLFERIPGRAVLTMNGEVVIVLRDERGVVFNANWYSDVGWDISKFPTTLDARIEPIPVI